MNIVFFDDSSWESLLPLTFTRPVAELRIGILKISEKWQRYISGAAVSFHTRQYLAAKFPSSIASDNIFINGSVLPDQSIVKATTDLKAGEGISKGELQIAYRSATPVIYGDP